MNPHKRKAAAIELMNETQLFQSVEHVRQSPEVDARQSLIISACISARFTNGIHYYHLCSLQVEINLKWSIN